jgi:hypothetical protein
VTDRSVPIQLDKLRHIRFTFNDLADMQVVSPTIFEKDLGDLSTIRMFLWAGLKHEDPLLQPYPAGERKIGEIIETWLDEGTGTIPDLVKKCTEAMRISSSISSITKKPEQIMPDEGVIPSKNLQETGSPPSSQ